MKSDKGEIEAFVCRDAQDDDVKTINSHQRNDNQLSIRHHQQQMSSKKGIRRFGSSNMDDSVNDCTNESDVIEDFLSDDDSIVKILDRENYHKSASHLPSHARNSSPKVHRKSPMIGDSNSNLSPLYLTQRDINGKRNNYLKYILELKAKTNNHNKNKNWCNGHLLELLLVTQLTISAQELTL